MTRLFVPVLFAVAAFPAPEAAAQVPALPRPATSPYLNLLRNGNPSYLNYYGLVRPEQQARAGLNNLQQQFNTSNQATQNAFNALASDGGVTTGTQAGFMTQRMYFMTFANSGGGFNTTNRGGGFGGGGGTGFGGGTGLGGTGMGGGANLGRGATLPRR